jgi:glyoxylate reductase
MADRVHVVITAPLPPAAVERIAAVADVVDVSTLPRANWDSALATADAIVVNATVTVDAALLTAAPRLRLVASSSVGYDKVDVAALRARGIGLTNTRGSLDEAVADIAFALVIIAMRRLGGAMAFARDGRWERADAPFGRDLAGATLGIVGFGGIGPKLAHRAQASGMTIVYSNRTPREDDARTGATYRPFRDLLGEADCVVVLVPLSPQTRKMFDDDAFAAMKKDAVLVNVARGAIVDTDALLRALDAGTIAGAALDVTDPEPLPAGHPLLGRDDVVVFPHVGSATTQTRLRMGMLAAENVEAFINGMPLPTPVLAHGS